MWALLLISAVIAKGFDNDEFSKFLFETLRDVIKDPFSIVIGFYFATQMLKGLLSK